MLSFTLDDMKTISSGIKVMTELCKIAVKDGTNSNDVKQMDMAFVVDFRSEISHINKQLYILFFFQETDGDEYYTNKYSTWQ